MFLLFLTLAVSGPDALVLPTEQAWQTTFSDSTWSRFWSGDTSHFEVENNALRLNGLETGGSAFISRPSGFSYGCWQFGFRQQGFNPSNQNRMHVWVMADSLADGNPVNGYAVRTGENGNPKKLRLFRMKNGSEDLQLLESSEILANSEPVLFRVCRYPDGVWELFETDPSEIHFTRTGRSEPDNTYLKASLFGIHVQYTATRRQSYYVTGIMTEKYPAFPVRLSVVSNTRFEIPFSEQLSAIDSIPVNWEPPYSTAFDHHLFYIETQSPLSGGTYSLGIADSVFTVQLSDVAAPGDIIINEFAYDVPDGFIPYVELFNNSEKTLTLSGWKLQRRQTTSEFGRIITTNEVLLKPREFIVITPDTMVFQTIYKGARTIQMPFYPPFNRSASDQIRLFSADGLLSDSLEYTPSVWGGRSSALERKSPSVPAMYAENWQEGNSPGFVNSARPDSLPPVLTGFGTNNSDKIVLRYNKRLHEGVVHCFDCIRTPARIVEIEHPEPALLVIQLIPADSLTLTAGGLPDLFGNASADSTFRFYFNTSRNNAAIRLNEFKLRGEIRFIEITNNDHLVTDIAGWKIGRQTIPENSVYPGFHEPAYVQPNDYYVITNPPAHLRNSDSIVIEDIHQTTIDSLHYTKEWPFEGDHQSLERIDPLSASNDPANWLAHPINHSAGKKNHHADNPQRPPLIVYSEWGNDGVWVYFDRFISIPEETRFFINGIQTPALFFDIHQANSVLLSTNGLHPPEEEPTYVVLSLLCDVRNRCESDATTPVAFQPEKGDIKINEIMYQPRNDRYSTFPDQSEYLELSNTSGRHIALEGIMLHDTHDKNGAVSIIRSENSIFSMLAPGKIAVLYADTARSFSKTRIANAFRLPNNGIYLRVNRSTLSLSVSGKELFIARSDSVILDSLRYEPSWHTSSLTETRGISLEKVLPDAMSNKRYNWASSAHPDGGTPGQANSVLLNPGDPAHRNMRLEPNPFSPDSDGKDDHQIIHYTLPNPDYSLRVRIFDRYGRLVRTISDQHLAGTQGMIVWDGFRDDGDANSTGVYIIHLEAYGSISGPRLIFKSVSVLVSGY